MAGNFGGFELQAGNADGAKYVAQVGREQNLVTYASFFNAMRFTTAAQGQGGGRHGERSLHDRQRPE